MKYLTEWIETLVLTGIVIFLIHLGASKAHADYTDPNITYTTYTSGSISSTGSINSTGAINIIANIPPNALSQNIRYLLEGADTQIIIIDIVTILALFSIVIFSVVFGYKTAIYLFSKEQGKNE